MLNYLKFLISYVVAISKKLKIKYTEGPFVKNINKRTHTK